MTRLTHLADLPEIAATVPPKTVAIGGGDRVEDLQAYRALSAAPFVKRCLLIGNPEAMEEASRLSHVTIRPEDVVAATSQEEAAECTADLADRGEVDVILKGSISTPVLNREMLRLKTRETISLVTLFQAECIGGGRPMVLTDAGVTVERSLKRMADMTRNAIEIAHSVMGVNRPRVALLAGNEKIIPSLVSTTLTAKLAEMPFADACLYGPLSFAMATDPESARAKGIFEGGANPVNEVAGKADVLVCPNLDSANVAYKILMSLTAAGQAGMAGVTVGVKVPYIILSRADNEKTRLYSVALSCIYSHWQQTQSASPSPTPIDNGTAFKILAINPGSTSTKLALFDAEECLREYEVPYPHKSGLQGEAFQREIDSYAEATKAFLVECGDIVPDALVGRGGFLDRKHARVATGVYEIASCRDGEVEVHEDIVRGVSEFPEMDHASNLGIPIAARLARDLKCPAFTVDPVVADDFLPVARMSGYAPIERRSVAHVLSIRAAARKAVAEIPLPLEKCSLVVAHLGGGITVAAVRGGRIVDNSIALLGEGPFTPQRAGTLPQHALIDLCYSGQFSKEELKKELTKRAGLISYLGEDRLTEVERRISDGDSDAELAMEAMAYQIAKDIGAMSVAVGGEVDTIVLSGGMARSKMLVNKVKSRVARLGPVVVFPQNLEMEAMAQGALSVLRGQQSAKQYQRRPPNVSGKHGEEG